MSLTPEQIATRRTGVTSTDASAIVGLNPYKSALEVYSAKVGEGPVVADNEAMWWGRALEPLLSERYARDADAIVLSEPGTVRHKTETWMLATPDRLVARWGEWPTWGLEIKTTFSAEQVKRWGQAEDRMPGEYIVQCQWCMAVTGLKRWDVAVLLGTYHGLEYRQYILNYDDRHIMTHRTNGVIARCRHFWFEHVLKDNVEKCGPDCLAWPKADGSASAQAAIAAMYPDADLDVKLADTKERDLLEDYKGAVADLQLAKQAEAEVKQNLQMAIGDAEGIEHPEIGTVLWKKGKGGKRRWNSKGVRA